MNNRAITTPTWDLLCVGLGAIIVLSTVMVLGLDFFSHPSLGQLVVISTLINGAHFMASYRLLYFSRTHARQYQRSSFYAPLLFLAYGLWAIYQAGATPPSEIWVNLLLLVTGLYLAVHYTGQVWGMMSSFAFIEGIKFDQRERTFFRLALKVLMAWQMVWTLALAKHIFPNEINEMVRVLRSFSIEWLVIAAALGLHGMSLALRRTGKFLPARVSLPFIAIFFWYLFLDQYPGSLVLVQIFHAIQYHGFPARVELNRTIARGQSNATRHLFEYLFVITLAAAAVFVVLPALTEGSGYHVHVQVLLSLINIHHFYVDGEIWKISNPVVREDLFAHLKGS